MNTTLTRLLWGGLFLLLFPTFPAFAQQHPIELQINQLRQNGAEFHNAKGLFNALRPVKFPQSELDKNAQRLYLDQGVLFQIMTRRPDQLTFSLPFNGDSLIVDLYQQNILTPDFNVRTGNWQKTDYTPGVYYRGVLRGHSGSLVAISCFDHELIGLLMHRDWGNLNLGRKDTPGNQTEYVLFEEKYLPPSPFADCETEDGGVVEDPKTPSGPASPDISGCVRQFFEADYALYQNKGNVQNTVNYVTGFFNAVASIYNLETVSIALSQVYVWTTPDPYDYASSATALNTFGSYRGTFDGVLAHLVSLEGSSLGGRAYINTICASGFNYAFSGINSTYQGYPTYSWTVNVVGHEMGHNFSSRHTHWCGWPGGAIDNCGPTAGYGYETPPTCSSGPTPPAGGGTLMSYCHLVGGIGVVLSNGFGPLPGDAIRTGVTTALNSGCITASCPTTACSAPTSISFSAITNTTATVAWNTVGGATGYNMQYRTSPDGTWTTVSNAATPYNLTSLSPNTAYEVQVQSICSGGTLSPYFTGAVFRTLSSACSEPGNLAYTLVSSTSVQLSWVENGSATAWEVQWGTQGFTLGSGTIVSVSSTPTHTLLGLTAGTSYAYYVRAVCGPPNGNSTWVGPVSFFTPGGNDLSSNAIELIVNQSCTGNIYNNVNASVSAGEFSPTTANGGYWNTAASHTVWFWFTAPAGGSVYITTDKSPQGTNDDTQIALYNTANPTSISHHLASNEDGGVVGTTYNTYAYYSGLTPGTPYYVQVDGWDVLTGSFCIEVRDDVFNLPAPSTCTSYTASSVNGSSAPDKWFNVYTRPNSADLGLPVAAVKSTSNLGTVTVREIVYPLPIPSTGNGVKYMQRYYTITNSSNTSAARDIRLFYPEDEFYDFRNGFVPPSTATFEDLNISRYAGPTFNCATNDNAGSSTVITSVSATAIGTSGTFFLQFNSGQGEFAAVLGSTPLPAELLRFEGFAEQNGNLFQWETTRATRVAHYALERSKDGVSDWQVLSTHAPTYLDADVQAYAAWDHVPLPSAYYRLAIVDEDGTRNYSRWVQLVRQVPAAIASIVPNPSNDWIQVTYNAPTEGPVRFEVYSSEGRLMDTYEIEAVAGQIVVPFDVRSLPVGLYYFTVKGGVGKTFVKQ